MADTGNVVELVDMSLEEDAEEDFNCPICYIDIPISSVFQMECCEKQLCCDCYSEWHVIRGRASCAFCRFSELTREDEGPDIVNYAAQLAVQRNRNRTRRLFNNNATLLFACGALVSSVWCIWFLLLLIYICIRLVS